MNVLTLKLIELGYKDMKKLIIINGVPGAGKTTTSKALYKALEGSVLLDGDWCWMMNPFVVNEENKEMVESNINFLLRSFLTNSSYKYVIFNWVIPNKSITERILRRLEDLEFQVIKISLICTPEVIRHRMELDNRPDEQIAKSVERLKLYQEMDTHKIDSTNLKVDDVVGEILKLLNN